MLCGIAIYRANLFHVRSLMDGVIMTYNNIKQGVFLSRPNRFIAEISINGQIEIAHVKNTGRCKELLIPNATIFLDESANPKRKTKYDLISVYKDNKLINMDSGAPNKIIAEWILNGNLFKNINIFKPETTYRNSRFDFYIEADNKKIFIEVKGVTLEENGIVLFPDAPTERGVKHINELCLSLEENYEAYIIFVVQMNNVLYFTPNINTHKDFGIALKRAEKLGVNILAIDCDVTIDSITARKSVDIKLDLAQ